MESRFTLGINMLCGCKGFLFGSCLHPCVRYRPSQVLYNRRHSQIIMVINKSAELPDCAPDAGCRNTVQRQKIMDYLMSVQSHPTAEEVYREVSKTLPQVSLATIYRNLNRMAESGQIRRISLHGEYRFDGQVGEHGHLLCTRCGKILDAQQTQVHGAVRDRALRKLPCGFSAKRVSVTIEGTCKDCGKQVKA